MVNETLDVVKNFELEFEKVAASFLCPAMKNNLRSTHQPRKSPFYWMKGVKFGTRWQL